MNQFVEGVICKRGVEIYLKTENSELKIHMSDYLSLPENGIGLKVSALYAENIVEPQNFPDGWVKHGSISLIPCENPK
jgi:hypothetical protein